MPFDHIASYDSLLTKSVIGQLQRKQVWRYLQRVTPQFRGLEILELNCGANEDAMIFSERGVNLVATDISEEMLKVTTVRANQYSMQNRISSQFLDPESFDETVFDKKFDLVFANFGGLNCLHPEAVKRLIHNLPSILAPGGRFIAVVTPKFCLWESLYFMMRLRFRHAFRRNTSRESVVQLGGVSFKSWYYNPAQIARWSEGRFKVVRKIPVGLLTPPVALEAKFQKHKPLIFRLSRWGRRLDSSSFFSGLADNFLIDLQLK
ncbi:class I SAM-dependent methyltransferase [Chryseolinea sp. T2]|uniref:class I SAM-dependent methyltransferase n=1 Tax=Chryseolinea sp. T2 TaxID=3129255 RepID=UPI0030778C61